MRKRWVWLVVATVSACGDYVVGGGGSPLGGNGGNAQGGGGGEPTGAGGIAATGGAGGAGGAGSTDGGGAAGGGSATNYLACETAGACFDDECGDGCCIGHGLTCAPICADGDASRCPPGPDGFDLVCKLAGDWTEHCAVDCKEDGSCPPGMVCSAGFADNICTWVEVPAIAGWNCDIEFHGTDDGCDCGCGIVDPDCADASVASCEYCSDEGSCNTSVCPGTIAAGDNAICAPG